MYFYSPCMPSCRVRGQLLLQLLHVFRIRQKCRLISVCFRLLPTFLEIPNQITQCSNVPLTAARYGAYRGKGATVHNDSHLAARLTTAAASRGEKPVPVAGNARSAVNLTAALRIQQRTLVEIRPFKTVQSLMEKEPSCTYFRGNKFRVRIFELFMRTVVSSKASGEECDMKRSLVLTVARNAKKRNLVVYNQSQENYSSLCKDTETSTAKSFLRGIYLILDDENPLLLRNLKVNYYDSIIPPLR